MPKIRIREIDNTTNVTTSEYPTGIFLKVSKDDIRPGVGDPNGNNTGTIITIKPKEVTTNNIDQILLPSAKSYNFIKQCLAYQAYVYIATEYTTAYNYLKDRNQYDIKFLLVNFNDEPYDTINNVKKYRNFKVNEFISTGIEKNINNQSDLLLAGMIAQKRKDCAIIAGIDTLPDQVTSEALKYTRWYSYSRYQTWTSYQSINDRNQFKTPSEFAGLSADDQKKYTKVNINQDEYDRQTDLGKTYYELASISQEDYENLSTDLQTKYDRIYIKPSIYNNNTPDKTNYFEVSVPGKETNNSEQDPSNVDYFPSNTIGLSSTNSEPEGLSPEEYNALPDYRKSLYACNFSEDNKFNYGVDTNPVGNYSLFAHQKLYANTDNDSSIDDFYKGLSRNGEGERRIFPEPATDTFGRYMIMLYGKNLTNELTGYDEITYTPEQAFVLAYLASLSNGNSPWLAIAGSKRGEIKDILQADNLGEDQLDAMQPNVSTGATADGDEQIAINPICNVNPYGVRIWGNRTAMPVPTTGLVASSFANVRLLLCELKKSLYNAARKYQFEQNSDILWVNFKSEVTPLLDRMVSGYGIAAYRWIKEKTPERAKFKARLQVIPIEAIEDFDLSIEMTDTLEVNE